MQADCLNRISLNPGMDVHERHGKKEVREMVALNEFGRGNDFTSPPSVFFSAFRGPLLPLLGSIAAVLGSVVMRVAVSLIVTLRMIGTIVTLRTILRLAVVAAIVAAGQPVGQQADGRSAHESGSGLDDLPGPAVLVVGGGATHADCDNEECGNETDTSFHHAPFDAPPYGIFIFHHPAARDGESRAVSEANCWTVNCANDENPH